MELLFLTQTYPRTPEDTSGPFIRELALALVRGGDRVRVLAPHARGMPHRRDDGGVEVEAFRYAPAPLEVFGYGRSLAADERVRGASLLVAPLYAAGAWHAVRRAFRHPLADESGGRGRPLHLEGQGVGGRGVGWDIVQAHWVLPNGPLARGLAARTTFGVGIHGSDVFLAERLFPARVLGRRALREAGAVTACSGDLRERAVRLGAPPERTRTVPYGVDTAAFSPAHPAAGWRRRFGVPDGAVLVLAVGRLVEKKGFRVLIDAAATVPGAHVLIAGDGSLREELRRHAESLHAPVTFAGALGRTAIPEAFAAADVVAVPSVVDRAGNVDGLPNTLLEALAAGRPVVASALAGIPDVVSDGLNGLLVKAGDVAALAAALRRLKDDVSTRTALAAAARRSAERELTWPRAAHSFEELFAQASSLDAR